MTALETALQEFYLIKEGFDVFMVVETSWLDAGLTVSGSTS